MKRLTARQEMYRQYLQSEGWKKKRLEAISYYGQKCNRCGEFGNDVHHKTYKRIGDELLSDLEVLCRECHQVHHAVERIGRKKRTKKKGIHVKAIYAYLSEDQKKILSEKLKDDLYILLLRDGKKCDKIRKRAVDILGVDYWYGMPKKELSKRNPIKSGCSPKNYRPSINY
jgi:hypothetical protein